MSFVIAATRAMPANWLGLRLAMALRRPMIRFLGDRGVDTELWGLRLRLYPSRNGCEKGVLFTPQMYDVMERRALLRAIEAQADPFVFIDIGANAGLYSLYVAAMTKDRARIIAIEPQPAMIERLAFNIRTNQLRSITICPVAVTAEEGVVDLGLDYRDGGGTGLLERRPGRPHISVSARPLTAILDDAGVTRVDALKADIEGAEDDALLPFLADAPSSLWPRLIIIEDSRREWKGDVLARLAELGYRQTERNKHNVVLLRTASPVFEAPVRDARRRKTAVGRPAFAEHESV